MLLVVLLLLILVLRLLLSVLLVLTFCVFVGPWIGAKHAPSGCNNPAPAYHPNGTLFLVCNHLDIAIAAGDWQGSWSKLRSMGNPKHQPGSRAGNWEDPYLWFDVRGNFHVVYHVYCLDPYSAHNECNAGHAYSADGFSWVRCWYWRCWSCSWCSCSCCSCSRSCSCSWWWCSSCRS